MGKAYSQPAEFSDGIIELNRIAHQFGVALEHTEYGWQYQQKSGAASWRSDSDRRAVAAELNQRKDALSAHFEAGTLTGSLDRDRADGKFDGIYG